MSALWSPQQCQWLAALGHTVYVPAPAPQLPDDPLLHALLRAGGRGANAAAARALLREVPAMLELRGNADAKRALWPRLRALRRALPR